MIYNSDIRVNSDKRIVVFSDIHADFHALLIALRDCAKVIRKKNIIDDLEYQLNLNLNNTTEYIDDLGYEWVSDCDTYVVLVGDIIDGSRGYDKNFIAKKINGIETTIHDYPQIELKILKFINVLNSYAVNHSGRIFKLLGNHEIRSILRIEEHDKKQTFERLQDTTQQNYIYNHHTLQYENRFSTFQPGNVGFNLLFQDGIGMLLKINDNIFVHGSLRSESFETIKQINNAINNNTIDPGKIIPYLYKIGGKKENNLDNFIWGRQYGQKIYDKNNLKDNYCTVITKQNTCTDPTKSDNFTSDDVNKDLQKFMGDSVNISNLRVIVGHCIQAENNFSMTTFTHICESDDVSEKLSGTPSYGPLSSKANRLFGISMECKHDCKDHLYKVYRVDVGASRSQDQSFLKPDQMNTIKDYDSEREILLSRSPQILEIIDDKFSIIRSKLSNTRIHQYRPYYEEYIKENNLINLFNIL